MTAATSSIRILRSHQRRVTVPHSYLVAVGGGAVLDAAGVAAASAHRGMRLIRVPTTVLSQDDSAMGVKNGINAFGKKNYLGTFAPPFAVINDSSFLSTLSDRDWRGGATEAVKAALIRDPDLFELLEHHAPALRDRDLAAMVQVIRRSAKLHLQHIATGGDPFEHGSSRPLDFGHWAAHQLEQATNNRLGHGEAVAAGSPSTRRTPISPGFLARPSGGASSTCSLRWAFRSTRPRSTNISRHRTILGASFTDSRSSRSTWGGA